MNRTVLFWCVITLAALACKATEDASPAVASETLTVTLQTPTPEARREICRVKTNVNSGVLNLRSCGGMSCSVIGYVFEGEPLTVLEHGAADWLKVETVTSVQGYVNSKFCRMENQ